jgi:hypothetical protein
MTRSGCVMTNPGSPGGREASDRKCRLRVSNPPKNPSMTRKNSRGGMEILTTEFRRNP